MYRFIETILINKGIPRNLRFHQRRVNKTTNKHFNTQMIDLKKNLLNPPSDMPYRCRITYSKSIEKIEYLPYIFVKKVKLKVVETDLSYKYKYCDREKLDRLYKIASQEGYDDALIVQNGIIKDTTVANIAFFDGTSWITPMFPLLAGTARSRMIESGFLKTASIKVDKIERFPLFALLNSLSGFYIVGNTKNIGIGT